MKDLIEALTILSKYTDVDYPTHCEHDVMQVNVDPSLVTDDDRAKLASLGFEAFEGGDGEDPDFRSYRFGRC